MSNFLPCFLRKYSPIQSICFLKHGRLYSTRLFRNIQDCNRYKSSLNFVPKAFSTKPTETFSDNNCSSLRYGGILKLSNSLNFYKTGRAKCLHGFYNYWMFSSFNCGGQSRNSSNSRNHYQQKNRTTAIYTVAIVIVVLGVSYAAVPLYRIFCQVGCILSKILIHQIIMHWHALFLWHYYITWQYSLFYLLSHQAVLLIVIRHSWSFRHQV